MGDRTSVWIRIGGQVKDLDALVEALENERMGPGWSGPSSARTLEDQLRAWDGGEGGVEFSADDVNYGNCDDLEEELKRQGLAYEFHWYAGCEYGEGGHIFTPEGEFIEYGGEGGGMEMSAQEIRASKFENLDALLAYMDRVDKFVPGKLVVPAPLIQAIMKARKENANG